MLTVNTIFSVLALISLSTGYRLKNRYSAGARVIQALPLKVEPVDHSKTCQHNICENSETYPEEKILAMLENSNIMPSTFGSITEPVLDSDFIGNRFGPDDEDKEYEPEVKPMCQTRRRTARPKMMLDINGQYRYIANVGNYTQLITYEFCHEDGGQCDLDAKLFHHEMTCKQKNTVVKFIVGGEKLEYGRFVVPSSCVCSYKKYSVKKKPM